MTLQQQLLQYIEKHPKTWTRKIESATKRGCSDVVGGVNSWSFAAEVKEMGDLPSCIQYEALAQATRANCFACIVTVPGNVKAVRAWLEKEYQKCRDAGQDVTKIPVLTLHKFKLIFWRLCDERARSWKTNR